MVNHCFVMFLWLILVHFFPTSVWALSVSHIFGAPTSQTKSWHTEWECDSHLRPCTNRNWVISWTKTWIHVNSWIDLIDEKNVSKSVQPSNLYGCNASNWFFWCCLGDSLFSILIGFTQSCVIACSVMAVTASSRLPSQSSYDFSLAVSTLLLYLIDCIKNCDSHADI